jgi:hypothetical protein
MITVVEFTAWLLAINFSGRAAFAENTNNQTPPFTMFAEHCLESDLEASGIVMRAREAGWPVVDAQAWETRMRGLLPAEGRAWKPDGEDSEILLVLRADGATGSNFREFKRGVPVRMKPIEPDVFPAGVFGDTSYIGVVSCAVVARADDANALLQQAYAMDGVRLSEGPLPVQTVPPGPLPGQESPGRSFRFELGPSEEAVSFSLFIEVDADGSGKHAFVLERTVKVAPHAPEAVYRLEP